AALDQYGDTGAEPQPESSLPRVPVSDSPEPKKPKRKKKRRKKATKGATLTKRSAPAPRVTRRGPVARPGRRYYSTPSRPYSAPRRSSSPAPRYTPPPEPRPGTPEFM